MDAGEPSLVDDAGVRLWGAGPAGPARLGGPAAFGGVLVPDVRVAQRPQVRVVVGATQVDWDLVVDVAGWRAAPGAVVGDGPLAFVVVAGQDAGPDPVRQSGGSGVVREESRPRGIITPCRK